jgi:fructokinase
VARLVDTVGAGDAFSAVVIVGMLRGWGPARLLRRAVRFAADLCTVPGATTGEVDLYRRHLAEWEHDAGA